MVKWAQFHQRSTYSFYVRRSQMHIKKTVQSAVSFGTFGTYESKSCTKNVGEIDTWSPLSSFTFGPYKTC